MASCPILALAPARAREGSPRPPRRKRAETDAQRIGREAAVRRSMQLRRAGALDARHGKVLLDQLGPNEGFFTAESSPHLFFLAWCLEGKIR